MQQRNWKYVGSYTFANQFITPSISLIKAHKICMHFPKNKVPIQFFSHPDTSALTSCSLLHGIYPIFRVAINDEIEFIVSMHAWQGVFSPCEKTGNETALTCMQGSLQAHACVTFGQSINEAAIAFYSSILRTVHAEFSINSSIR